MGGRIKKRDPLAGDRYQQIREATLDGLKTRRRKRPSEKARRNATGSILPNEYDELETWAVAQDSNVSQVMAALARLLLQDSKLQQQVKQYLIEEELSKTIAKLERAGLHVHIAEK